jgi:putative transposase
MVEEMLVARGTTVSYETVRHWGLKFGREITNSLRRGVPRRAKRETMRDVEHRQQRASTIGLRTRISQRDDESGR